MCFKWAAAAGLGSYRHHGARLWALFQKVAVGPIPRHALMACPLCQSGASPIRQKRVSVVRVCLAGWLGSFVGRVGLSPPRWGHARGGLETDRRAGRFRTRFGCGETTKHPGAPGHPDHFADGSSVGSGLFRGELNPEPVHEFGFHMRVAVLTDGHHGPVHRGPVQREPGPVGAVLDLVRQGHMSVQVGVAVPGIRWVNAAAMTPVTSA